MSIIFAAVSSGIPIRTAVGPQAGSGFVSASYRSIFPYHQMEHNDYSKICSAMRNASNCPMIFL